MTTSHPVRVGSRVAIYWKLNNLYYPATIIDSNKDCPHTHTYLYDDGSQERFDLRCAKYLVLHGPIPMAAYLAIEAEAGRPTKEDACNDTDDDSSTSVPVGPPPKKKRCVAQSPAIGRPLTRGYQKRFMMMSFIMKPNSRHSHYRMNLPDKPKQWLPEGDEELTEEVHIVLVVSGRPLAFPIDLTLTRLYNVVRTCGPGRPRRRTYYVAVARPTVGTSTLMRGWACVRV